MEAYQERSEIGRQLAAIRRNGACMPGVGFKLGDDNVRG
jgi:hypothetical protein